MDLELTKTKEVMDDLKAKLQNVKLKNKIYKTDMKRVCYL